MESKNKNLQLIQGLRGAASLLVVLFHTSGNSIDKLNKEFLGNIFFFGSAGVDVFFVLSGFIITYTSFGLLGNTANIGRFFYKRAVRIFPSYWIIISFFLLAQLVFPAFYRTHFSLTINNIAGSYLLVPGHQMVNGVSWSLSYELFFYFLFAIAFIIRQKKWAFYLAGLYAMAIITLCTTGYSLDKAGVWTSLLLSPMNIEFFFGVLAAALIARLPQIVNLPFMITGILLLLAGSIYTDKLGINLHPVYYQRVLLFGIPSFFLIIGLVKFELSKNLEIHGIFLKLGEASYSIYLLHLPLLVAFMKVIAKFNVSSSVLQHLLILTAIYFICCIGVLFYKFVEKPLIGKLNALYKNKRQLTVVST